MKIIKASNHSFVVLVGAIKETDFSFQISSEREIAVLDKIGVARSSAHRFSFNDWVPPVAVGVIRTYGWLNEVGGKGLCVIFFNVFIVLLPVYCLSRFFVDRERQIFLDAFGYLSMIYSEKVEKETGGSV